MTASGMGYVFGSYTILYFYVWYISPRMLAQAVRKPSARTSATLYQYLKPQANVVHIVPAQFVCVTARLPGNTEDIVES